ncbi:3-ketoacyl-ACP reductase [Brooklawnia sp.]|uniref:3-ketoacyl-ACP reductase n=1 Tax=Brooklawnia sp. TaxID=2699740 RepID=UPI0031203CFC
MNQPTAIVTGGSRGIGLAIAKKLIAAGYNVGVLARKASADDQFHRLVEAGRIYSLLGDITDASTRETLVNETVARFGQIDLLCNNAGTGPAQRVDILEMPVESYDRVMDVNLRGPLLLTQKVAALMITNSPRNPGGQPGIIVNTGSASATMVSTNRGEYCISKAGVSMATKLFAIRLAEHGIPVYEVSPGIIRTEMTKVVTGKYDKYILEDGNCPIPRWGEPDDVAEAVMVLAEGRLKYSTGDIIYVDGGMRIPVL